MPVYTLTTRILDGFGQVRAVKQTAFQVLTPEQDLAEATAELAEAERILQEAEADLEAAAWDKSHPKHHWWQR